MSKNLGNINIILTNTFYKEKEKGKSKLELINENNYYALLNKKRKRHLSKDRHFFNANRCPSCVSASLRKYYKHIHDNDINNKNNIFEDANNTKFSDINKESFNISKDMNMDKNNLFFLNASSKFNENSKIIFNNDDNSNQETLYNIPNNAQNKKTNGFSKYIKSEKGLFNTNIINKNEKVLNKKLIFPQEMHQKIKSYYENEKIETDKNLGQEFEAKKSAKIILGVQKRVAHDIKK